MTKVTFKVEPRKTTGKKVKNLRQQMLIPGNVHGGGEDSVAIKFPQVDFIKLFDQVGETGLIYLQVGDNKDHKPTLVDQVQTDPVSGQILHTSFKQVNLKEKIEAEIPVEFEGEFDVAEAVMVQVRNTIEVEALPTDLPEKFVVNVESLEKVGDMISLQDLDFDRENISLLDIESDEDWEKPVVLVQEQREEEEEPEETDVDDVEVEGEVVEDGEEGGEEVESKDEPAEEAAAEDK